MRVKPEDLKIANKVAGIKETTSTSARRNYWNGVHRLKVIGQNIVLMTNDGSVWLEWKIPFEGEPVEMDVLVQERPFDHAARYLDGGSLEISRVNRVTTLGRGTLHYRLKEETPQQYPEPVPGENPVVWRTDSASLAKALRFVGPFIDETNPNKNKSVGTLYTTGTLTGGNSQRIATAKGLTARAELSFKARTAKVVAEFLSSIGDNVEISVSDRTYVFKDPDNGHRLVVLSEEGRFPTVERDLTNMLREVDQVDRKMLLGRAKAFAGTMPLGADRLNLSFRGSEENASLHVYTPGDTTERTDDEFAVYREFPVPPPARLDDETDEAYALRVEENRQQVVAARGPAQPLEIGLNREFLAGALDVMEGTQVKFKICGTRMVLVEDELGDLEEGTVRGPEKSILLTAQQGNGPATAEAPAEAPAPTPVAAPPAAEADDEEGDEDAEDEAHEEDDE